MWTGIHGNADKTEAKGFMVSIKRIIFRGDIVLNGLDLFSGIGGINNVWCV